MHLPFSMKGKPVDIAAGWCSSYVIFGSGEVASCGLNNYAQLGTPTEGIEPVCSSTVFIFFAPVHHVHSMALLCVTQVSMDGQSNRGFRALIHMYCVAVVEVLYCTLHSVGCVLRR